LQLSSQDCTLVALPVRLLLSASVTVWRLSGERRQPAQVQRPLTRLLLELVLFPHLTDGPRGATSHRLGVNCTLWTALDSSSVWRNGMLRSSVIGYTRCPPSPPSSAVAPDKHTARHKCCSIMEHVARMALQAARYHCSRCSTIRGGLAGARGHPHGTHRLRGVHLRLQPRRARTQPRHTAVVRLR
jgi:hypothetical protein